MCTHYLLFSLDPVDRSSRLHYLHFELTCVFEVLDDVGVTECCTGCQVATEGGREGGRGGGREGGREGGGREGGSKEPSRS